MIKQDLIWTEKYRPKVLSEYVGSDHIKVKFGEYNNPPHVLLYGKPGTGKTTLARILTKNMDCDELYINASDESGVDIVRTKIKPFAGSVSFHEMKIVVLDEADFLSPSSQAALRHLMEQFSKITRFVLTCNYHERIIDPIVSRCQVYEVFPPSRKDVAIHIADILQKESIVFTPENIKLLVDASYPDIRQIINSCQRNVTGGNLLVNKAEMLDSDFKLKLLDILVKKDKRDIFKSIRQIVADNHISDFTDIYRFLYDMVDEYAPEKIPHIIVMLGEGLQTDVFVPDKEINFMTTITKIISII